MKHLPINTGNYKELLRDFCLYIEQAGYKPGTCEALSSHLREFFYRMEQQGIGNLEQITPPVIRSHYLYLGERPSHTRGGCLGLNTISYHMYALKTFMNYQEKTGAISRNPFSVLSFPRTFASSRQALTRDEIKALYHACETLRDRAIINLFYGCGLRRSEAEKLNTTDISFTGCLLYVRSGKGRKRRVIPMTTRLTGELQNYFLYERNLYVRDPAKDNQNAFMLNNEGLRMSGGGYWKKVKYLLHQAGLPPQISLHHLRHSIATHLLEEGLSIEQVRDFLGHSCLETTQIYTHIDNGKYLISETL